MKNKILILVIIAFFITGCSCEYDLNITDNNYSETVKMIADNQQQIDEFNKEWEIPTKKSEYFTSEKGGYVPEYKSELYDYKLTNNTLTFSHDFTINKINNSTAIANCYDTVRITNSNSITTIATSQEVRCFYPYPELERITVTITVDRDVISNNADHVSDNKYVWYINKSNKNKKPINMTIDNKSSRETKREEDPEKKNKTNTTTDPIEKTTKNNDYSLYIFCGVLLIVMLIAYFIYNKLKKNEMDD